MEQQRVEDDVARREVQLQLGVPLARQSQSAPCWSPFVQWSRRPSAWLPLSTVLSVLRVDGDIGRRHVREDEENPCAASSRRLPGVRRSSCLSTHASGSGAIAYIAQDMRCNPRTTGA